MKEEVKSKKAIPDPTSPRFQTTGIEETGSAVASIRKIEMASAAARAALDYRAHGSREFKKHLRNHLANGYVFSAPNYFMMGKAVLLEDGRTAWYITYALGDPRRLAALMPFPLPFIAFRRRGRGPVRVYETEQLLRRIKHG